MKPHTGFTLIEILVVIVMVSILVSITMVAFGDFGESRRERSVLSQFADVIQSLQEKAVLRSEPLVMRFSAKGYSVDGEMHNNTFHLFSSIKIATNNDDQEIVFSPNGLVTPFVLTAQNKGHEWEVQVKSSGAVFIE